MQQTYNIQVNYNAYYYIEPAGANSITIINADFVVNKTAYYSTDGSTWVALPYGSSATVNSRVLLSNDIDAPTIRVSSGNYNIGGQFTEARSGSFPSSWFKNDTLLVSAKNLIIKSYNIDQHFYGCTSLTDGPQIYLYGDDFSNQCSASQAFYGCTSLVNPPKIELIPSSESTSIFSPAFDSMFFGCTSLTKLPQIVYQIPESYQYTNFNYNFSNMFYNCTALVELPQLSFDSQISPNDYFTTMFANDTSIKLSTTQVDEYQNEFRIPTSGTSASFQNLNSMFYGTGGTFTGTPSAYTTYYTSNQVVEWIKEK